MSTHAIARLGEQIIFDLLPNSTWKNPLKESGEYYDILWENIKINVKTSGFRLKNGFQVGISASQTGKRDVIYVIVGLEKEKKYFWVMLPPKVSSNYLKIKDSIAIKDLQKIIKKEAQNVTTQNV